MKRFSSLFLAMVLAVGLAATPGSANGTPSAAENALQYQGHGPRQGDFSAWTKVLFNGIQMKFYVKYPQVGQKIQFIAQQGGGDYRQIAWKRVTEADLTPTSAYAKLQNFVYFIRTVDLKPGKNRFRIIVDGKQVGTTKTYSMPEISTLPAMPWEQTSLNQVLTTFISRSVPDYSPDIRLVKIGEKFELVEGAQLQVTDIGIYDVGSEKYEFSVSRIFSWHRKSLGLAWGNFSVLFEDGSEFSFCEGLWESCELHDSDEEDGFIFNESLPFGKTPFMLKINPSERSGPKGMPTYGILLGDLGQHFNSYRNDGTRSGEIPGVTYKVEVFENVARIEIAGLPRSFIGKTLSFKQLRRTVSTWEELWEFPELMFSREIRSDKVTILIRPIESVLRSWVFAYVEDEPVVSTFVHARVVPLWMKDAIR